MSQNKSNWFLIELAIVAVVIAVGAYVRMTDLTCLPPGLYPDEAMNTTDGLTTAEAGRWELFYENNQGREGLYINILGYLLHWFGPSLWIVRFLPALIGTLTLPAIYWLGRRLCGSAPCRSGSGRFGSLVALGLMAFSYWHINFSRIGFRALLMVFLLAWAFAFLGEGFWRIIYRESKKFSVPVWVFFAAAGLILGLSLHTYIAVRIAPAVVVVLWVAAFIFFANSWKDILRAGLVTLLFAAVTAAPMLYDFAVNPTHFAGRTNNVSVLKSPHMIQDLGKSVFLTLASFVAYGDQNWRHNYPLLPLVLPVWGIILFIGVVLGVIKFFQELAGKLVKKGNKSKDKNWELVAWVFLIAWWVFLLVPSILTNEGLPHALRSIGAIPPTFILIGFMVDKWTKNFTWKVVFSFLVVINAFISVYAYFFAWGGNSVAYGAFEYRLSGMGIYLREEIPQEPTNNFYVVTNRDSFLTSANLPVLVEPVRFFTWQYRDRVNFIMPDDFDIKQIKLPAKIVLMQENNDVIQSVKSAYPQARLKRIKVGGGGEGGSDSNLKVFAPEGKECFLASGVEAGAIFPLLEVQGDGR